MNANWKALLGIILVFILGGVAGCLGTSIYIHHRTVVFFQRGVAAYVDLLELRMTNNLALDAAQKQKIHQLFIQNLEERKKLQAQIQPEVRMLNLQTFQQIKSVLNPNQMALFRENMAAFRKHLGQPALDTQTLSQPTPNAPANAPATNATPGN